jgi:hypothetical protein
MKNPVSKLPCSLSPARAGWSLALAIALLGATAPRLAAQSDDFNAGNDNAWAHYALPGYGAPTYSFPPDGSGGKAYRIYAPPLGSDPNNYQYARTASYRPDVSYTNRFLAGVDLLAWNATWDQQVGLLFYLRDPGIATTDAYGGTYSSVDRNLYINLVFDENPITVGAVADGSVALDPSHSYRLVASSHDASTFLFQVFDRSQPNSPWASVIAQNTGFLETAGMCGLIILELDAAPTTAGADATYDNYAALVPAAGAMPTTVTDLFPPPAGKATDFYPTITVGILDRDTTVDTSSIVLCLDGVWIPNASLTIDPLVHKPQNSLGATDFGGATVTYPITALLPWGGKHTNIVAFRDSTSAWQTNTWTWTTAYPYLLASNSLPLGSLSVRGFDTRMVQSYNGGTNLANSLARALQQLATPPQIPIDQTATSIVQVLDWNKAAAPPNNVPGLCTGDSNNIAVQALAYLELTAGLHRFHINTDDRAGVYSGVNLADTNAMVLWENPGSTANATFEFIVEADGLYPVRCIWEETGGGAALQLRSVDLNDLSEVLINDPSDPPGVVKAWYPIVCQSSSSVSGPYTVAAGAANSLAQTDIVGSGCSPTVVGQMVTGGTFTVPVSGATRFYRLDAPRATRITTISKDASQVVITYQAD